MFKHLNKNIVPTLISVIALLQSACASVAINSVPTGAEVVLEIPGQKSGKVIGKTPLTTAVSDIAKQANNATIVLTIKKQEFQSQSFVIPNLGSGKLEISASLQPLSAEGAREINLAVRYVLEAERQIIDKDYKNALKSIEKAKATFPNMAAAYMFEGIIFGLQNDKQKAIEAFQRALSLDPTDTDVRTLLTEMGGTAAATRGGNAPAARGGRK
jgi:tetratricopeptide (TPR) repeat protein